MKPLEPTRLKNSKLVDVSADETAAPSFGDSQRAASGEAAGHDAAFDRHVNEPMPNGPSHTVEIGPARSLRPVSGTSGAAAKPQFPPSGPQPRSATQQRGAAATVAMARPPRVPSPALQQARRDPSSGLGGSAPEGGVLLSSSSVRRSARPGSSESGHSQGRSRRSLGLGAVAVGFIACVAAVVVLGRDDTTVRSGPGDEVGQLLARSPDQAVVPPTLASEPLQVGGLAEQSVDGFAVMPTDPDAALSESSSPDEADADADAETDTTSGDSTDSDSADTTASSAVATADAGVSQTTAGASTTGAPATTARPTTSAGVATTGPKTTRGSTGRDPSVETVTSPTTGATTTNPPTPTARVTTRTSARPTTATTDVSTTGPRATATTLPTTSATTRPPVVVTTPTTLPTTPTTRGTTVATRPTTATTATPRPTTATTRPTTTTTRPTTTTTRATTTTTPTGSSGQVVWEDNFSSFDSSTWRLEHSTYGDGNNELQCYRPENVSVANGKLKLRAVTETYTCPNGSTRQVTSGMIRSQGVTFSPGQAIEFRVKLNPANPDDQGGLWPAVWASGWAGGGWPAAGEMDWLEVMTAENPNRAMFSVHYADASNKHKLQNKGVIGSDYFSDSWHTVRFDYGTGGRLTWYLDGKVAFQVNGASTLQGYPAPFDETVGEIKINLALGGRPGPLAPGAVGSSGASFEVDYIRILNL